MDADLCPFSQMIDKKWKIKQLTNLPTIIFCKSSYGCKSVIYDIQKVSDSQS